MARIDNILPYFSRALIYSVQDKTAHIFVEATLLSADIVGFTAVSRELARSGKEGAEELTAIANRYLAGLIAIIDRHGGDVLLFGGDALVVAFDGKKHALQAARCGIEIQDALCTSNRVETSRGTFVIGMHVGISSGDLEMRHAGGENRLHFLIRGKVLESLCAAEEASEAGQVIITSSTHHLLDAHAVASPCHSDLYVLSEVEPDKSQSHTESHAFDVTAETAQALLPYLPPELRSRVASGSLLEEEHRPTAILFGGYHDPDDASSLDKAFKEVDACVGRFGGTLMRDDFTKSGPRFLVLFGAPQALEDAAFQAVQCALELRESVLSDLSLRLSVCYGQVFAGEAGSDMRKEYTVIGDAINLAARLAERARSPEILIDSEVYSRVEGRVTTGSRDSIQVKGIDTPVAIHSVGSLVAKSASMDVGTPLIGREAEIAAIPGRLEKSVTGSGQIVTMTGPAGIGKTRLVQELIREADRSGVRTVVGRAQSHSINKPYASWTEIVESVLDLPESGTVDQRIRHIEAILEQTEQGASRWLPLLTDVIDLPVEESDLTRSMTPELRQPRVYRLIRDLILLQAKQNGLAVVFEDAHWMDVESQALLLYLVSQIEGTPILLVVSSRPGLDLTSYESFAHHEHVSLEELSAEASSSLLEQSLGMGTISNELSDLIREQAQGNPLYVCGIAESLLESDVLVQDVITGEHRLDTTRPDWIVPENLNELILSRLDRLPGQRGRLIREASVIGSMFETQMLHAISQQDITHHRLTEEVDALVQSGLLLRGGALEEYQFAHALVQEAAYDTLPFARRRELQQAIARELERLHSDDLSPVYDQLAHHYLQGDRREKALEFCEKAGDRANERFLYKAAIDYYSTAIDLADGARKGALLVRRAQAWNRVSETDHAMPDAERGLRISRRYDDPETIARALFELGKANEHLGEWDRALSFWERAAAATPEEKLRIRVHRTSAYIHSNRGHIDQAREHAELALRSVRGLDDPALTVQVLAGMGGVARHAKESDEAIRYWTEGLRIAREIHDRPHISNLLSNLSMMCIFKQDYETAYRYANESLGITKELGDPDGMVFQLQRLARLKKEEGRFGEALEIHEERLRLSRETGSMVNIASCLGNLGYLILDSGHDPATAIPRFEEALALCEKTGVGLPNNWNGIGRAQHLLGDLDAAEESYRKALGIHGGSYSLGLTRLAIDRGNLAEARDTLRQRLARMRQEEGPTMRPTRILVEFGRLEAKEGNPELAALYLIRADMVNPRYEYAGPEIDRGRALLKEIAEEMGPAYEAFKRKAEGMALEQVVERALEG